MITASVGYMAHHFVVSLLFEDQEIDTRAFLAATDARGWMKHEGVERISYDSANLMRYFQPLT